MTPPAFFLFGAARSGTNALTWTLQESDQIVVKNEDSADCFDNFALKDRSVIEAILHEAAPKPVFFKCFHDTPRARYLLENFSDSRAVYSIRQPRDCIGSFINEFGQAGVDVWLDRFEVAARDRKGLLLHISRDDPISTEIAVERAEFVLNELSIAGITPPNVAACYYLWAHSFADHINVDNDNRFIVIDYDRMVIDPQITILNVCQHFSIKTIKTNPDRWFKGRGFGKSIDISPRLLEQCQAVYDKIIGRYH